MRPAAGFGRAVRRVASAASLCVFAAAAPAQLTASLAPGRDPVSNSDLDAPLFYQLLIGELEAAEGRSGQGVEVVLDAARRTHDEAVFRRATEMAVQAHAGEQALAATKAWRSAVPRSREAIQLQLQILFALGKANESAEPLQALLAETPENERSDAIAGLPRLFVRITDRQATIDIVQDVLKPYFGQPETRTAARTTLARVVMAAGNEQRALDLLRGVQSDDPGALAPALAAAELMATDPRAEALVKTYLARPDAEPTVRLVYSRVLTGTQRLDDAAEQLRIVVAQRPDIAAAWLSLAAHSIELKRFDEAEQALDRYLALVAEAPATPRSDDDDEQQAGPDAASALDPVPAWLMLSQIAEARGDYAGATAWLDKAGPDDASLSVISRRAELLAHQGRLDEARALIANLPERDKDAGRAKVFVEAELLREAKRPAEAYDVLARASAQLPNDAELLYEQAMLAEKIGRVEDMERLLRKVIELQPEHAQAHNALGYSLADRNERLPEARALIEKALTLSPGDPFIVDSLGWVEFRLGHIDKAVELLKRAYASRADVEIAAHLGEVLWAAGRHDEARQVFVAAKTRDADNEVLRATLQRLDVSP